MKRLISALLFIFVWPVQVQAETVADRASYARQGIAALMRGKYENAISSYDLALDTKQLTTARRAAILNDRGVAKWRLKKSRAAIADFTKAIRQDGTFADAYASLSTAYGQRTARFGFSAEWMDSAQYMAETAIDSISRMM